MWPDWVNGAFECLAGIFVARHCLVLFRHKSVRGVSVVSTAFFTAWGIWNLYYYPHLGQWWSFIGGIAVVLANVTWVSMMVYYTKKERRS